VVAEAAEEAEVVARRKAIPEKMPSWKTVPNAALELCVWFEVAVPQQGSDGVVLYWAPLREWTQERRKESVTAEMESTKFTKYCKIYAYVRTCMPDVSAPPTADSSAPPSLEGLAKLASIAINDGLLGRPLAHGQKWYDLACDMYAQYNAQA
jgi:hypothetical protein